MQQEPNTIISKILQEINTIKDHLPNDEEKRLGYLTACHDLRVHTRIIAKKYGVIIKLPLCDCEICKENGWGKYAR